ASICATIFNTRRSSSTLPCGRRLRCETLAPTYNIAEAFLHAATHAPQPMHEAASKARSASCFGIGIALPSGAPPVETETYPPDWMIRLRRVRSTTRFLMTGKDAARHGSIVIVSPSL